MKTRFCFSSANSVPALDLLEISDRLLSRGSVNLEFTKCRSWAHITATTNTDGVTYFECRNSLDEIIQMQRLHPDEFEMPGIILHLILGLCYE